MEQNLSVADQREQLLLFLREAADAKIAALYTLLEDYILPVDDDMPQEEWDEMMRDRERYVAGELPGKPWRELIAAVRESKVTA